MIHNWKIKKQIFFCLQSKNFPPDKRHPGHRSRYGNYGPRTACQPIKIENFEKPYNKYMLYSTTTKHTNNSNSNYRLRVKGKQKSRTIQHWLINKKLLKLD
jgi:hypothetical protein